MSDSLTLIDDTHDAALCSWVESANAPGCDWPVQNLPYGRFRRVGGPAVWHIGVAIGDQVLDLKAALEHGRWSAEQQRLLAPLAMGDLNALMAEPAAARSSLRAALSQALRAGSDQQALLQPALLPQADALMGVPCHIGDYTDFFTGIHHATAVGTLFRPDNPLLPNYKWVPIGYHGRASSIGVSGQHFKRPHGQLKGAAEAPVLGASQRVDYELELGVFIGPGNALGEPIAMGDAEEHLFGVCLLNDWSARDVQTWEYQPLGPFLAKNFATTVSPWVVTLDALAPYRNAFTRPEGDPQPLPYLDSAANRARGAFDIELSVWLQTQRMRDAGEAAVRLSQSNVAEAAYWTLAQLITHHTVNGCNLQPGDLLGSGTLSGPTPEQGGSMLELSQGGKQRITLPNGETRAFMEDGDTVTLRGHCERAGAARIGLGEVSGTLVAAAR